MLKIRIEGMYDGFAIIIIDEDNRRTRFSFDQEDSQERMVDLFRELGFETEYEEVY